MQPGRYVVRGLAGGAPIMVACESRETADDLRMADVHGAQAPVRPERQRIGIAGSGGCLDEHELPVDYGREGG